MRLNEIVNKVAFDLMPIGTIVERMIYSNTLEIGEKVIVDGYCIQAFKTRKAILTNGDYFLPECFRVVKESE